MRLEVNNHWDLMTCIKKMKKMPPMEITPDVIFQNSTDFRTFPTNRKMTNVNLIFKKGKIKQGNTEQSI